MTGTTRVLLLPRCMIRTQLPNGSVRCAAVFNAGSKIMPLAVRRPASRCPYHEAIPICSVCRIGLEVWVSALAAPALAPNAKAKADKAIWVPQFIKRLSMLCCIKIRCGSHMRKIKPACRPKPVLAAVAQNPYGSFMRFGSIAPGHDTQADTNGVARALGGGRGYACVASE